MNAMRTLPALAALDAVVVLLVVYLLGGCASHVVDCDAPDPDCAAAQWRADTCHAAAFLEERAEERAEELGCGSVCLYPLELASEPGDLASSGSRIWDGWSAIDAAQTCEELARARVDLAEPNGQGRDADGALP